MLRTLPERRAKVAKKSDPYRLDLTIGRMTYRVEPLEVVPPDRIRAFRLTKADGTAYDVSETPYGPECDCPDFIFRRDGLDPEGCKHVRALAGSRLIGRGQA